MSSEEDLVIGAVKEILDALKKDGGLDIKLRVLKERVAAKVGLDIAPYNGLIKAEANKFVDAYEKEQEEISKKRKLEEDTPPGSPKYRRLGSTEPGLLELGDLKRVDVRAFKGKVLIDLRAYYEDKQSGELKPGKKGIALSPHQWKTLVESKETISNALGDQDEDFSCPLSGEVRVGIFKNEYVDIREWYEKDGEEAPGKKGLSLSENQWKVLLEAIPTINEAVAKINVTTPTMDLVEEGKAQKGALQGTKTQQAKTAEPSSEGGGGGKLPIWLGTKRRADISKFKGRVLVDIREVYERDGEMLPGKKGISLTPDQFEALHAGVGDITEALEAADSSFELSLGNRRNVKIFKGMVDIREYYTKDGKELPGSKGIALPRDQWTKLAQGLPVLAEAVDRES